MTSIELSKNMIIVSPRLVEIAQANDETNKYIKLCLDLFFSGMYGEIDEKKETDNLEALKKKAGEVRAKYPISDDLKEPLMIIARFNEDKPGVKANHVLIVYESEVIQEGG